MSCAFFSASHILFLMLGEIILSLARGQFYYPLTYIHPYIKYLTTFSLNVIICFCFCCVFLSQQFLALHNPPPPPFWYTFSIPFHVYMKTSETTYKIPIFFFICLQGFMCMYVGYVLEKKKNVCVDKHCVC